jgi:hypothetical protein
MRPKVKIQVYVPGGLLDAEDKRKGEYLVFDSTGQQGTPSFTNAQRLGIGTPVIDIVRQVIKINRPIPAPKKLRSKNRILKYQHDLPVAGIKTTTGYF